MQSSENEQQAIINLYKTLSKNVQGSLHDFLKNKRNTHNPCRLDHQTFAYESTDSNVLMKELKRFYENYQKEEYYDNSSNYDDANGRIIDIVCKFCSLLKLGLITNTVQKPLVPFSCTNPKASSGETPYVMGEFAAAQNPYKTGDNNNEWTRSLPSENIAIPKGCVIIPEGSLLMQMLALDYDDLIKGIKIVQIMSEEEGIDNYKAVIRFMARNGENKDAFRPGYYVLKDDIKMEDWNSIKQQTQLPQVYKKLIDDTAFWNEHKEQPDANGEQHTSGLNYIAEYDAQGPDKSKLFSCGYIMKYVHPEMKVEPEDITMKVFDMNPVFNLFCQFLANIVQHDKEELRRQNSSRLKFKKNGIFQKDNESGENLIDGLIRDMLILSFALESNHEKFFDLPPLNDKCSYNTNNILFINKYGKAIMEPPKRKDAVDTNAKDLSCSCFNRLVTKAYPGHPSKLIPTIAISNANSTGIIPHVPVNTETLLKHFKKSKEAIDEEQAKSPKEKYKELFEDTSKEVEEFHELLISKSDNFNNYYCEFKDDMNEDVLSMNENQSILAVGANLYPQNIYRNTGNKKHHPLDYSQTLSNLIPLDTVTTPNTTYARGIGFVSIDSICDGGILTLKNSSVMLQNIINRCNNNYNFKRSDRCRNPNTDGTWEDEEDDVFKRTNIKLIPMPKRRKLQDGAGNSINLCGSNASDFDYSAYRNLKGCNANFDTFTNKYKLDNNRKNCPY